MVRMEIKKSTDHNQFKTLKGNRIVYKVHLNQLLAKIREKNLLDVNPIIINEKKEVIDGQHRLAAASALGLPIYYIEKTGLGIDDIIMLNTASKKWKFDDYLHFYVEQEYIDYVILNDTTKKYGLSSNVTAAILSTDYENLKTPIVHLKKFKRGEFEIHDLEESINFIKNLIEVRPFALGNVVWGDREFIRALWVLYYKHGASHELLMDKFRHKGTLISYRETVNEYLLQLVEISGRSGSTNKINVFSKNN